MNPFKIAACIIAFTAAALFCTSAFSKVESSHKIAPNVTCYSHTTAEEIGGMADNYIERLGGEVLEDSRPYKDYDGFIQVLSKVKDVDVLREIRWKGKLLCEKIVVLNPKES